MEFLLGHLALVLGVVGLIGTFAIARLSTDARYADDSRGAAAWFAFFVFLRLNAFWVEPLTPANWDALLHVTWMLAFAFAAVRFLVGSALWLRRLLTKKDSAKIHRDVVDFLLYVLVTIPILRTQLKIDVTTLLGTSAVLSLVLGFALQDTLGNLFSGLSLQLESPYSVGDFIRVGEKEGRVVQIAWRSTRIETMRRELITIPNSLIAKDQVTNYSRGGQPVAIDLEVGANYDAPPNVVKAEMLESLREAPTVLNEPPPWVRVSAFADNSVTYHVRFFIADFAAVPHARDEVLSRLWYRFGRRGIEIPFPQRVVHFHTEKEVQGEPDVALLRQLPLLQPFTDEEAVELSRSAVERRFGEGEEVITEGRPGTTFYMVASGKLSVRVGQPPKELATLERGAAFGEMSLLTGEPRAATVVAQEDCVLLEMGREAFSRHLQSNPERLAQLAALIENRKAGLAAATSHVADTAHPQQGKVLDRLRDIFAPRRA